MPVWFYREAICYYLFFRGVFSRRVKWRASVYELRFGGRGVRKPTTSLKENKSILRRCLNCFKREKSEKSSLVATIQAEKLVHPESQAIKTICPDKSYSYEDSIWRAGLTQRYEVTTPSHIRAISIWERLISFYFLLFYNYFIAINQSFEFLIIFFMSLKNKLWENFLIFLV